MHRPLGPIALGLGKGTRPATRKGKPCPHQPESLDGVAAPNSPGLAGWMRPDVVRLVGLASGVKRRPGHHSGPTLASAGGWPGVGPRTAAWPQQPVMEAPTPKTPPRPPSLHCMACYPWPLGAEIQPHTKASYPWLAHRTCPPHPRCHFR